MSIDLNHIFLKFIKNRIPDFEEKSFLLAVSGGIDSVLMAYLFHNNNLNFTLAHCNFQLRGEESDGDEAFVASLAKQYSVLFQVKSFETNKYASKYKVSTQMAARTLRYDWFTALQDENKYDYICTAHHLDDSVETQLFNLFKGTGYKGMAGIYPLQRSVFRPMLPFSKHQIVDYAKSKKLTWREDRSNKESKYQRNYIRNEIIDQIREINSSYPENQGPTLSRLRGASQLLTRHLDDHLSSWINEKEEFQLLPLKALSSYNSDEKGVILDHWLKPYGFNYAQVENLLDDIEGPSGAIYHSETHLLNRDRDTLILSPGDLAEQEEQIIEGTEGEIEYAGIKVSFQTVSKEEWEKDISGTKLQIDSNLLDFPLILRQWKPGDWFVPLGLKGKKKISDFMIDRKIPVNFKARYPVLVTDGKIAGVCGLQVDDRFKVDNSTKEVFIIKIEHA